MTEKFNIHLQGTSDTKQWIAANGVITKMQGSVQSFVASLKQGVGIDLGGRLVGSLARLPTIFGELLTRGVKFNATMSDSQVAIANVLQKFTSFNEEAAKQEAAKAMEKLIELEPEAAGSLQDLTSGLLATVGSAQAAGISIGQNIELVGMFANALANANIPAEQLTQELRAIFTGNITPDAALGKLLNITNADVAKAKEAGKLYDLLVKSVGTLGKAGDTTKVAMSSLQSAIDGATGALAKGLFQQGVDGAKNLTTVLNENRAAFEDLGEVGGDALKSLVNGLSAMMPTLKTAVDVLRVAGNEMGVIAGFIGAVAGGASIEEANAALQSVAEDQRMESPQRAAKQPVEFAESAPADPFANLPPVVKSSGGGGSSAGSGAADQLSPNDEAAAAFDKLLDASEAQERVDWARKVEDAEISIVQARAAGNEKLAEQFEDQKSIMELARRYRTELDIGINESLAKAKQRVGLERAAANAANVQKAASADDAIETPIDQLIARAQASRRGRGSSSSLGTPLKGPEGFVTGSLGSPLNAGFDRNNTFGRGLGSPLLGPSGFNTGALGSPLNAAFSRGPTPLASNAPQILPPPSPALNGAGSDPSKPGEVGDNKSAAAARAAAQEVTRLTALINGRDGATASELAKLRSALVACQRSVEDAHRKIAGNRP